MSFTGTRFSVSDLRLLVLYQLFPGVDVERELQFMENWCNDNPRKAARKKDWEKFQNNWLKGEYRKMRAREESRKREARVGAGPESVCGIKPEALERIRARGKVSNASGIAR